MGIIRFEDVWELYRIKFLIEGKAQWEDFVALQGINLTINPGETVGLIGENGSGKSTMLKLIYGMIKPDKGKITVNGKVCGLLDLGAGFQPELTGRENIYLISSLFGLKQDEIAGIYNAIASFADIGKFINAPVKCYSQGMFVRLGFAIAIHMNPEILLIDDALSVGDEQFQKGCIKKIFDFKERGKTIILVTHDTNMLRRLCARTIFIKDGAIIKDGLTDKVVPFYSQMFGPRNTKEIITQGELSVIFNNGRLSLNWRECLITPHYAGHTTFGVQDVLYRSYQADWEVLKIGQNKITAHGVFYQLGISQDWEIELVGNGQVKWKIVLNREVPVKIERGYTNLVLSSDYLNWSTPFENGVFPEINETIRSWQRLFNSIIPQQYIAVSASPATQADIPTVIFEEEVTPGSEAEIFNSDYLNNYRVLQFRVATPTQNDDVQIGSFGFFCGKITVGLKDPAAYLEHIRSDFILSEGNWKAIFNNGRLFLYFKGQSLTKDSHLDLSFLSSGKWYSSDTASWQVQRCNDRLLVARGRWVGLNLEQIWKVQMQEQGGFSWEVSYLITEPVQIEQQRLQLSFVREYTHWFSEYGQGEFPRTFQESDVDLAQRCLNKGPISIKADQADIPWLCIEFPEAAYTFAKIFNSSFFNKSRVIRIERIEPEDKLTFFAGEHSVFKVKLGLQAAKNVVANGRPINLVAKDLGFIFQQGRGKIFWKGIELTKQLGFYTSLRSLERWHDSINGAFWNVQNESADTCTVIGRWLHLPVIQSWQIKLVEPNCLDFTITIQAVDKFSTDRIQINSMFVEKYDRWFGNGKQENFPEFSGNCDDDWSVLFSKQQLSKDNDSIGIAHDLNKKVKLPKVTFTLCSDEPELILAVLNSDLAHRGRVLQCLRKGKLNFNAHDELCYRGKLTFQE